jgi:hypothetical protein
MGSLTVGVSGDYGEFSQPALLSVGGARFSV